MKPFFYEPKCRTYECKSSLLSFYAISVLFFTTAKLIRISLTCNKTDAFSCIFVVQTLAQTASWKNDISPIHYYIYKGDSGYRRDEKMLHSAKMVPPPYSYLHFALDFTTFQDKKKVNQNILQHQDTRHKS